MWYLSQFFSDYLIKRYHRVLVSFRLGLMKRCVVTLQNSSQWKKYRYHWPTDQHLTTSKWLIMTKNPTLNVTNSKTKDTTERTVKSRKLLLLVLLFWTIFWPALKWFFVVCWSRWMTRVNMDWLAQNWPKTAIYPRDMGPLKNTWRGCEKCYLYVKSIIEMLK